MIIIYWKDGMSKEATNAVIRGARKFAELVSFSKNNIIVRGADIEMNRYEKSIPRIHGLFNAGMMNFYLIQRHPDNTVLFLTDEQLCDEDGNYFLGLAKGFHIVVSSASVKNLSSLTELTMHELGHAHGMTYYGRPDTEQRFGSHCTNPGCLMQQTYGINAFERHVSESRRHEWFCETCIAEAKASNKRKGWYQTSNLPPRRKRMSNLPQRNRPNLPPRRKRTPNLPQRNRPNLHTKSSDD